MREPLDMKMLAETYDRARKRIRDSEDGLAKVDLPPLTPCCLKITPEDFDREKIERFVQARAGDCIGGWLRRQSAIEIWPLTEDAGTNDAVVAAAGAPLTGEWAVDGNESGRLQYLGDTRWRVWTYKELPFEHEGGLSVLREDSHLLAHPGVIEAVAHEAGQANGRKAPRYLADPNVAEGTSRLNYAIYWGLRHTALSNGGASCEMGRLAARFTGFVFKAEETQQ